MKKKELKLNPDLVSRDGNRVFTTIEIVADGCKLTHQKTMDLVRKYKTEFEELGQLAFETRVNKQGSPTEFTILNEDQATYLITLFRNTDIVRKFKDKR